MLRKFTTITRKSDNDVVHLRVQHEFGSLPPINHYIHFEEEVSPSHRFLQRQRPTTFALESHLSTIVETTTDTHTPERNLLVRS